MIGPYSIECAACGAKVGADCYRRASIAARVPVRMSTPCKLRMMDWQRQEKLNQWARQIDPKELLPR